MKNMCNFHKIPNGRTERCAWYSPCPIAVDVFKVFYPQKTSLQIHTSITR